MLPGLLLSNLKGSENRCCLLVIRHVTAAAATRRQLAGKTLPVPVIAMLGTLEMGPCSSAAEMISTIFSQWTDKHFAASNADILSI